MEMGFDFMGLVTIILLFGFIPLLATVGVIILVASKRGKTKPRYDENELQLVQEAYTNLERMEKRIESLETLLVDEFRHAQDKPPDL